MNHRLNLFKPVGLAALLLMLGSGLASAGEPVTMDQSAASAPPTTQPSTAPASSPPTIIHLAWDRVGAMA